MTSLATRLSKCTAQQLKSVAELIGVNTTATKKLLVETLQTEIRQKPRIPCLSNHGAAGELQHQATRILSIDMGIRNLAFCVLEVQQSENQVHIKGEAEPHLQASSIEDTMKATQSILGLVKLVAWKRTSLYDLLHEDEQNHSVEFTEAAGSFPSRSEVDRDENGSSSERLTTKTAPKEAFDPATFANLTYKLVTRVFLPYNVSHVLIERQRYRSGSAPAIMEWTVRVNMLESMLHAVFGTLRSEALSEAIHAGPDAVVSAQAQKAEAIPTRQSVAVPQVHSISPRKVGVFWDRSIPSSPQPASHNKSVTESTSLQKPSKAKIEKEAKMAIAEHFLSQQRPDGLQYSAEAEDARRAFLAMRDRKSTRRGSGRKKKMSEKPSTMTSSTKLDDLADCLLQGTAWAQWELNRAHLQKSLEEEVEESTV